MKRAYCVLCCTGSHGPTRTVDSASKPPLISYGGVAEQSLTPPMPNSALQQNCTPRLHRSLHNKHTNKCWWRKIRIFFSYGSWSILRKWKMDSDLLFQPWWDLVIALHFITLNSGSSCSCLSLESFGLVVNREKCTSRLIQHHWTTP